MVPLDLVDHQVSEVHLVYPVIKEPVLSDLLEERELLVHLDPQVGTETRVKLDRRVEMEMQVSGRAVM